SAVVAVDVARLADGPLVPHREVGRADRDPLHRRDRRREAHPGAAQLDVLRMVHAQALARGVADRLRAGLAGQADRRLEVAVLPPVLPDRTPAALQPDPGGHALADLAEDLELELGAHAVRAADVVG